MITAHSSPSFVKLAEALSPDVPFLAQACTLNYRNAVAKPLKVTGSKRTIDTQSIQTYMMSLREIKSKEELALLTKQFGFRPWDSVK
jgi:Xaa-Pro aminopeptidase